MPKDVILHTQRYIPEHSTLLLKMKALYFTETSVEFEQIVWCSIWEDSSLHNNCFENLKSYKQSMFLDVGSKFGMRSMGGSNKVTVAAALWEGGLEYYNRCLLCDPYTLRSLTAVDLTKPTIPIFCSVYDGQV
jgi:hypothetical protein